MDNCLGFQLWYSQDQSVISTLNVLQITHANNSHVFASDLLQDVTPEVLVRSCDQWSSICAGGEIVIHPKQWMMD